MTYNYSEIYSNPSFLVTTHTSSQDTSNTANVSDVVSGSLITYTPTAGASKVVYEISYYSEKKSGHIFQCVYLEEYSSGSWSEINQKYRRNYGTGSGSSSQTNRYYLHFRFVLPAWSGSKQIRLRTSSEDPNENTKLHQLTDWDGDASTSMFCNTNLIVYSI